MKEHGQDRILHIFFNLMIGQAINVEQLSEEFQCNKRTIQRDLSKIRELLEEHTDNTINKENLRPSLIYHKATNKYHIRYNNLLTNAETLIIIKILLASRALSKTELNRFVQVICYQTDQRTKESIQSLFYSELYHYQQVTHQKELVARMELFLEHIENDNTIETTYKSKPDAPALEVIGVPLSIMFNEHYFYVRLYSDYSKKVKTFRLDRFEDKVSLSQKAIKIPHTIKVEDGLIRKNSLHMFAPDSKVVLGFSYRYWGPVEVVLETFPGATIATSPNQEYVDVTAPYSEKGAIFWLLSQGAQVQVTAPLSLKQKIKQEIDKMQQRYN